MPSPRKIVCLGAGYVGGPTMAVMALHNPDIQFYVTDQNEARIAAWIAISSRYLNRLWMRSCRRSAARTCTSK
jgi:3-hydroxyacyl-CoA dehydrogenase